MRALFGVCTSKNEWMSIIDSNRVIDLHVACYQLNSCIRSLVNHKSVKTLNITINIVKILLFGKVHSVSLKRTATASKNHNLTNASHNLYIVYCLLTSINCLAEIALFIYKFMTTNFLLL